MLQQLKKEKIESGKKYVEYADDCVGCRVCRRCCRKDCNGSVCCGYRHNMKIKYGGNGGAYNGANRL